jgi:uncharacterized protein
MNPVSLEQKSSLVEEESTPSIELFATGGGTRAVESPVRVTILAVLRDRELSFHEIVSLAGKAKSTVSAHLKALLHEGIIGEKPDLADSRRKIFYIRSQHLGDISPGIRWKEDVHEGLASAFLIQGDPSNFYKHMFRTIRVSLLSQGINIDPILREAGYRVGEGVYQVIADPDISKFLEKTGNFWKHYHLGRIEVENLSPVTICVYDCFECGDLPLLGRPACAFDAGMLDAMFSLHFRAEQMATELRCYAMGDDHCKFVIRTVGSLK